MLFCTTLLAITDSNNLYTLSTDEFFYLSYFVHVQCPPQAKQEPFLSHVNAQIYLITFQSHKSDSYMLGLLDP